MGGTRERLLQRLGDGQPHSGEALAAELGISRAAVWKHIERLRGEGYPLAAVGGLGYQWRQPWLPLREVPLRRGLGSTWRDVPLTLLPEVDSTNTWLRARNPQVPAIAIAERQTGGRGRLARGWSSPPGGLYFSVAWQYQALESGPAGLGLLAGIHLAESLHALGIAAVGVKWPNDLVHEGAKLAGILCELSGDPLGRCTVVVGVGINWRAELVGPLDAGRRAAGLADLLTDPPPRPELAGRLAAAVLDACRGYPEQFADAMRHRWPAVDALSGREITLRLADHSVTGRVRGVDESGALVLETRQGLQRHLSGDTRVLES